VIIKPLTPSDIPDLVGLWKLSGLPVRPKGRDSVSHLEKEMKNSCSIFLKAVDDSEKIVGAVLGTHDGRKGWINRLAVHPDFRNQGIAWMLVLAVEEKLKELGIHIVSALIEDYNTVSMKTFEKLGYVRHDDIVYFSKRESEDV
jgi:N-acetylglutamate synthase